AHGEVYALIAFVRAGTQNDLIRDFTKTAEEFVGRHMDYLESTGLVDWFHIPPPPEPHGTKSRFLSMSPAGVHPLLIWLILGAAAPACAIPAGRTLRPRCPAAAPPRPGVPPPADPARSRPGAAGQPVGSIG